MTNLDMQIFPYGKFYDTARQILPCEGDHDIIVYTNVKNISRAIGSLEGVFLVLGNKNPFEKDGNIPCKRNQMIDFEERYNGKFVAFKTEE